MENVVEWLIKRRGNLVREQILIIRVPPDCIKCGNQVRLLSNTVPNDQGYQVVVFQVGSLFYETTPYEWSKFEVVSRKYRAFSLGDRGRDGDVRFLDMGTTATSNTNKLSVSTHLRLTMSQEIPQKIVIERDNYPLKNVRLLWPYPIKEMMVDGGATREETTHLYDNVIKYATTLFDFFMVRKEIPSLFSSLEYKWLRYISKTTSVDAAIPVNYTSILFLVSYVRSVLDQHPINDELVKEWIQFEVYLFKKSPHALDEESFRTNLQRHIHKVGKSKRWQHHQWHSYPDWRKEGDGYAVSSMWLFEPEFSSLVKHAVVRGGTLFLEKSLFYSHFLPTLYRHILLDIVSLIYDNRTDLGSMVTKFGYTYHRMMGRVNELLVDCLPSRNILTYHMVTFSCTMVDGASSPFLNAIFNELDRREDRVTRLGIRPLISSKLDIEDLFKDPTKVLPPCLSRVATTKRYKHNDRWNMVSSLIDMGYQDRDKVVGSMCGGIEDLEYQKDIITLYDEAIQKKNAIREGYRISLPCNSIINAIFPYGNVMRCVYEEEVNGDDRKESTTKEKDKYRAQCACQMTGRVTSEEKVIKSPLDYIEYKVSNL
jgi:hypothetical protein